jgi:peptide chain release factor 3
VLGIQCAPVTWPVGMGKRFGGVFDLRRRAMRVFEPGEERAQDSTDHRRHRQPELASASATSAHACASEIELVRGASQAVRPARRSSPAADAGVLRLGINNFGVQEVLDALVDLAPPPGAARSATSARVEPDRAEHPASCSRSRPTWTRRTATASPSCACARAASSAA